MNRSAAGFRPWFWAGLALGLGALAAWAATDRAFWGLFVAASMGLAATSVWATRRAVPRVGVVLGVAILLRLFWLPMGPGLSDDSYRYAWDGWLVSDGINPYRYVPEDPALSDRREFPPYDLLNSRAYHSVYPPASQVLFAAAHRIARERYPGSFYVLKGLVVLLELLALFLLARMVPPGLLLLFSWNPVVLIAGAGQAHTDALLALPIVVAVWASRRDRWGLSGAAIALAAHVKLWPALAAGAFLRRRSALVWGLGLGLLLAIPFWEPGVLSRVAQSLDLYVRYFEFNAGPYYAVKEVLRAFTGDDWSKQLGPFLRNVYAVLVVLIWAIASRRRWGLESVLYALAAWQIITATTVHPWYLYAPLLLAVIRGREYLSWQWLSAASVGTYLLYIGGPYWSFVWLGWLGFAILAAWEVGPRLLEALLRRRAGWKADWLAPHLGSEDGRILDVGGGEGYVAEAVGARTGRAVHVAEVATVRRAEVPFQVFDGRTIPHDADSCVAAYAVFVLHHAEEPIGLLREMARVARGPLVIVESVVTDPWSRRVLRVLDPLIGRLRGGGGLMTPVYRSPLEWRKLFEANGFQVTAESIRYNLFHRKHLYVLRKAPEHP